MIAGKEQGTPLQKKRGRPRKTPVTNDDNTNNVDVDQDESVSDTPPPRKRGRPRKSVANDDEEEVCDVPPSTSASKGRGRPRKFLPGKITFLYLIC